MNEREIEMRALINKAQAEIFVCDVVEYAWGTLGDVPAAPRELP